MYQHVLRVVCAEEVREPYVWLTAQADDPVWAANYRREEAERIAARMRERNGQPLPCQNYQLPPGCPVPFELPSGCQRTFWVSPDDVVTSRPTGTRQTRQTPPR